MNAGGRSGTLARARIRFRLLRGHRKENFHCRLEEIRRDGLTCDQDCCLGGQADRGKLRQAGLAVAAAYTLSKLSRPKDEPRLNEVIRLVARLGGFLARKGDGEPGVKTLWIGLQRVMDFAAGVRFTRQDSAQTSCVQ